MPPPDRWEVYTSLGKVIPKTNIIAFKVPLKKCLQKEVEKKDQFSPNILIKKLRNLDLKLGLIIDLTFTHKYYDRQEFLKDDILHKKIFVKGHVIPDDYVFQEFVDAVKSCDEHDSVVGVHCTHGVNRTGYLICRYMIEELDIEPEEAISLFNEARGHSIERENYLEDLKSRRPGEKSLADQSQPSERKKDRWRHHKEDHPDWRCKNRSPNYRPYEPRQRQDRWDFGRDSHHDHASANGYEPRLAHSYQGAGHSRCQDERDQARFQQAGWDSSFREPRGARDHWPRNQQDQACYQPAGWGSSYREPRGPRDHWPRDQYGGDHSDSQGYQQAGWGSGQRHRSSRGRWEPR